jgi:hypothetical protein
MYFLKHFGKFGFIWSSSSSVINGKDLLKNHELMAEGRRSK